MKTICISVTCGLSAAAALVGVVEVANGERKIGPGALSGVTLIALPTAAGAQHWQLGRRSLDSPAADADRAADLPPWF